MVVQPMKQGTYRISSGYGPRWGSFHAGLDFAAPLGTPIYAVADGVIVQGADRAPGSVSGFGNWVWQDSQKECGKDFIYGHMRHHEIYVRAGQRVKEGQLIARVGSEGQSTGAHLHFEVWGSPGRMGGRHENPANWLKGKPHPGAAPKPQVKGGSSVATTYGVDVSVHQDGMSLKRAAAEGVDFAIIRTTDGTYKDKCYQSHLADAESAGLVTAAYHYLRNPSEGTSVAQQVQASLQVMGNKKRPMWIDVETNVGLHVDHIRACKREFERHGVRVIGAYSYVPYWEGRVAPREPDSHEFGRFWVAAYGRNASGKPRDIYPGNNHRQWGYPLGNQKPSLWQFGSNAQVAGYSVDINAFRGTKEELRALFYGTKPKATPAKPGKPQHKEDTMTDFDQINRRYKSRVPGSKVTMTPLDMVRNIDAHAFIAKENTERLEKRVARMEAQLQAIANKLEGK